eukprot:1230615-Pleurochrysis_carterae.AAC.1
MLPIAIMLHCVASVFFSHHKELEARSLVSGDAVYTFWYDAERTVGSAAVAVPFGVGVGAAALLSGTLVADAWRARAKEKLKAMMMRRRSAQRLAAGGSSFRPFMKFGKR